MQKSLTNNFFLRQESKIKRHLSDLKKKKKKYKKKNSYSSSVNEISKFIQFGIYNILKSENAEYVI